MQPLTKQLRKYFIMGSQNCLRDPREILTEAIHAGITSFQFREKGEGALEGEQKLALGRDLRDICFQNHVLFIVNDDILLAHDLDADGIHVGQDDPSVTEIRTLFPHKIIGLSVSTNEELRESPISSVDYVGAGPIFPTSTKTDAKQAVGLEWIQTVKARHPHTPLVAIGGITTHNAASVINAGADGVSVISAITKSPNIKATVTKL